MIAWIDLETTGLDHTRCGIIELACIVTDNKLKPVNQYESWVVPIGPVFWDDGARKLHIASGLIDEWLMQPTKTYEKVDSELFNVLMSKDFARGGKFFPAGSSVHFDMDFVKRYLPKTAGLMHYRILDVSSIKILFSAATGIPTSDLPPLKSETTHRAMADIKDSLAAAQKYVEAIQSSWKDHFYG